jgi:EAL domain-containing protein (putative c-di-GMP-specific phosphodiesterase class I)
MAAAMAEYEGAVGKEFLVDYSLDIASIPTVSAASILGSVAAARDMRGKKVVIGTDIDGLDSYFLPGVGKAAGAYVQIIGAETLKSGRPRNLGWLAPLLVIILGGFTGARQSSNRGQNLVFGLLATSLMTIPVVLEANLVRVDVAPALFFTLAVWSALLWRRYSRGGIVHPVSGLPNLSALRSFRKGRDRVLVAARVLNYADVVANLPTESEKSLVEQIVSRLAIGSPDKTIFHGDGGIFAWFEEGKLPFGHHVDALHAMFRSPVKVGELSADLSVSFGVEIGSGRSLASRLASALVAAEEAAHDGLRWKLYDPEKLRDASWRLSILSQLDDAIDSCQVWVAYQPKLDLRTRQIIGAEALARWTHPAKGPIPALEFVHAAEQHDRIGKLTDFVLDNAIRVAAKLNTGSAPFHIAVNLSARLLGDRDLSRRIAAMLLEHVLDPQLLTLEVTETSAITSSEALATLAELRELGTVISIDDYGTGLSTLEYLKKIPASEIKIDQSFVRGILDNRSDRLMVQSTIALAHSLNRVVVAEGVESAEILDELAQLNCDVAQGFIIGRPMSSESLRRRILVRQRRSVA